MSVEVSHSSTCATVSRWMMSVEVSHSSTCATVSRWMMSVEVRVTVLREQQCQGG